MGELDDALAGLRTEALAATSADFERVRVARRRYLARRATAAVMGVALVVGGGAIAFAGGGFLEGRDRHNLVLEPGTPTPTPEASSSEGGPPPTTVEEQPFASSALAWDAASSELLLLGSRCLEYECIVELRSFDNHTSSTTTQLSRGFIDPEGNSTASSHFASDLVVVNGTVYAYGPSLFVRAGSRWVERPVEGSVTGIIGDPSGSYALVQTCTDYPHATGCALDVLDLGSAGLTRVAHYKLRASEYVTELSGSPAHLVVVLADNTVTRELRGSLTSLHSSGNPCTGWITASLASQGSSFLEVCNMGDTVAAQRLSRSTDDGASWKALPAPAIGDVTAALVWPGCPAHASTVLELPEGGRLQVSLDAGGTWQEVAEIGVDGEQGRMLATCAGDELRVLVDAGSGPVSLWTSRDGRTWAQTPIE